MKKILVVATHPDDETLGCGGVILKHKAAGDHVSWLIMTRMSDERLWPTKRIEKRRQEIKRVAEIYGFDKVFQLDYETTTLDQRPMADIVRGVSEVMQDVEPDIVYVPFAYDSHTDHQVAFKAVLSCTKSFRYPSVQKVLMYETCSETEFAPAFTTAVFNPNVFSDISDYFDKKIDIMRIYEDELMDHPFPRSEENLKALAVFRGARAGYRYAEAFMLLLERN